MSDIAPNPVSLTGAQRRALRALGHSLKAVVRVGRNGISPGVLGAITTALDDHELVKLSLSGETKDERRVEADIIAERTGSHVAQLLGRTALIYRRRYDDPEIVLPGAIEEAPRKRPAQEDAG